MSDSQVTTQQFGLPKPPANDSLVGQQVAANVLASLFDVAPALVLERYRIRRTLGSGASGVVYEAWDERLERVVALKVVRGAPEQVLTEAKALAKLAHRNIVTVFDAAWAADALVIVMEYVEGESLRAWLAKAQRPDALARVLAGIGVALTAIHAAGLSHGDIKPENVLVDQTGQAKVGDFGLARLAGKATRGGTPGYVAPEALAGGRVQASDTWAYAVLVLEAHGVPPSRAWEAEAASTWQAAAVRTLVRRRGLPGLRGEARQLVRQILEHAAPERPLPQHLATALTPRRRWRTAAAIGVVTATGILTYAATNRLTKPADELAACQQLHGPALALPAPSPKVHAALLAVDAGGARGQEMVARFDALYAAAGRALPALGREACLLPPAVQREILPCAYAAHAAVASTLASLESGRVLNFNNVGQMLSEVAEVDECRLMQQGKAPMPHAWLASKLARFGLTASRLSRQALRAGDAQTSSYHAQVAVRLSQAAGYEPGLAVAQTRLAYALTNLGKLEEAQRSAHAAVLAGERAGDPDATVTARTLSATLAVRTGDLAAAKRDIELAEATATRWNLPHAQAMVAATRAVLACTEGSIEVCIPELDRAIALGRRSPTDIANTLEVEMQRVNALLKAHRYREAAQAGREVYAAHQQAFGKTHRYTLEAGVFLVHAAVADGQHVEAQRVLAELHAAAPQGVDELRADIFMASGSLWQSLGEYAKALADTTEALAIKTAMFGPNADDKIPLLHNAAMIALEVDPQRAEALAREGKRLAVPHYGSRNPAAAVFDMFLRVALARQGRHAEAQALGRAALKVMLASPDAGYAAVMEAEICVTRGAYAEAARYFAQALQAPSDLPALDVARTRFEYAAVLLRLHQGAQAQAQVNQALAALQPSANPAHARLAAEFRQWLVEHAAELPAAST